MPISSLTNQSAKLLPPDHLEVTDGWGMSVQGMGYVFRPTTLDGIKEAFATARAHGRKVVLRGNGRSYGDAALKPEAVVLDLTRFKRVLSWDPETGIFTAEPGLTLGELWKHVVGDGWWPPVVSGTMFPTLGGAVAANIHGKNNFKAGPIGDHVLAFELITPDGRLMRCSREAHADVFFAAIGGFGLLGCFTSITLSLKKIHSGFVEVTPHVSRSLREMLAQLNERIGSADYLVGWVDCFASEANLGRGIVHEARHLPAGADVQPAQSLRAENQALPDTLLGFIPKSVMWLGLKLWLHKPGMRLLNWIKYMLGRLGGKPYRQTHAGYHFLLDYVPDWQRAYLPGGLIQFQSFIPREQAHDTFRAQLQLAQRSGLVPYLGVLKRHRPDEFLLSHGVDGYSLALDFHVTRGNRKSLWRLAEELSAGVVAAGGRFYLAKDATLTAAHYLTSMPPESLATFRALKTLLDPDGILESQQARRVGLTA